MAIIRTVSLVSVLALGLAGCGTGTDENERGSERPAAIEAPVIGTDMPMPVDDPFCTFTADAEAGAPPYVFVTQIGESIYYGYAELDGEVTRLTEVEAGFGAGIETRRYVTEDEGAELEVILLETGAEAERITYSGSVRAIFPVEGAAVKFIGECRAAGEIDE
ncbi:MAG: hypothetical protein WA989_06235 [Henriciella sp.]|uniref:hypothetical protein n=1 Tax=Henriciella sp. TaxID=1968823 RepID=UPI003C789260